MSAPKITVFADPPFSVGTHATLGESDAHHLRVARIGVGERVGLRDGAGHVAEGVLVRAQKAQAVVEVDTVTFQEPPAPIHVFVPVADRDRMLWLAEKAAELGVASWRPVLWQRSKSVSPRGEGSTFRAKVRARMTSALLQSRGAWLPEIFPETSPELAIAAAPVGARAVLDATGGAMLQSSALQAALAEQVPGPAGPSGGVITVAIGPEGGFEAAELERLAEAGFVACTLGPTVLRFETAAVAAVAVARSMLLAFSSPSVVTP